MKKENRYPPTHWPDTELPAGRIDGGRFQLDDGGWISRELMSFDLRPPPLELHLREMREVDPASPDGLRGLCDLVGAPLDWGQPWRGVTSPRMLPHIAQVHAQRQADNLGDQLDLPPANWSSRPARAFHVREVALRVALVRLLVDHVDSALSGADTAPVWQRAGFFEEDALTQHEEAASELVGERPLSDESSETVAWARFAEALNEGLSEFSPRLLTLNIESEPDTSDVVTAYAASCAHLFNDLRDQVPYRRCADETCGRLFRRQIGRSKGINKPRATGVDFCTHRHAMNQSRRDRKRAALSGKES
jgi:hypothetical protein